MAIHDRHDFHAFSALRGSDFQPATLGHNEGCVDEAFFAVLINPNQSTADLLIKDTQTAA